MPIAAEPISEVALDKIDSVRDWISETQNHLRRVPIEGVFSNGATFHDDEYLGDGDVMWRFNARGIRSLCQRVGFRFDQLAKLETPTLASQVLNDLIRQKEVLANLAEYEFVLDDRTSTVIGIVSRTYISYTNEQFLTDMNDLLIRLAKDDAFQFHDACGINTELTVRFRSEKRHGTIKGSTGLADDRTEFGLDFQNSMVGTSSVRINYFLYRLVCANGMMVPAATSINRVFHSGNRETFKCRLTRSFSEVLRKLDSLQSMLTALGSVNFEPDKLALDDVACQRTFELIPALKQTISDREGLQLRYPRGASEADKRKMRLEHDTEIITLIPKYFGGSEAGRVFSSRFREGASMFDFLNVFTEYAKNCLPAQKLDIEEKAGTLAKYIAENVRKF